MITNSFDPSSKPLIEPLRIYKKAVTDVSVCIVTYSSKVLEYVKNAFTYEVFYKYHFTNGCIDIYKIKTNDQEFLFYMSPIGAPVASMIMYEISQITGCNSFVFFGSCGVLDESVKDSVIVPTDAYRDEGVSYHYLEPTDYIHIRNYEIVERILKGNGIEYSKAKIWTTDAIYMETVNKAEARRLDGCKAVEMEIAGLEAVSRYYAINTYYILFGGDVLKTNSWDRGNLGGQKETEKQLNTFDVALLIAQNIM